MFIGPRNVFRKRILRSTARRRITVVALVAIATTSVGLFSFGSDDTSCAGPAPTAGTATMLTIDPPTESAAAVSASPRLHRRGAVAYHNRLGDDHCCLVIAHGGGSVDGLPYTNSLEALNRNYKTGHRVFEIDFSETCDGSLVLLHDWKRTGGKKLSREEFLEVKSEDGHSRLDLDGLANWVLQNPDSIIVTDAKGNFDRFLQQIEERFPSWFIERHFVLQVYDLDTLDELRRTRPNIRLVLTTYRIKHVSDESLAQSLKDGGVVALTMPLKRSRGSLSYLRERLPNLPIYVHGSPSQINEPALHAQLEALGARGFYLD